MLDTPPNLRLDAVVAAAAALPAEQPVVMLNLLRYRDQATYDDPTTQPPRTGHEAYQAYIAAFLQYNDPAEFTIVFQGAAQAQLAGLPGEQWDAVALVEYRNLNVFRRWVESDIYTSQVAPIRRAALADWRLLLLTRPGTLGAADTGYLRGLMAQETNY
ncbi:DUF1330 domain-containing protein [Hymenobacter sp. HMF4947]|uniref:DUF1330 domain-containing protein n=1 Tax=Hymenobacter ginkgonis TaxID=2682976 RepID=A0A7K1TKD0_9BACT|nr:DUF1330 domain-containing protein [Hymenobacter ginkgonis]MVN78869.1 DUF1330 domain-containing protein [Hymenobacter ginkgonis]